ncbi:MAG: TonB-dependent receptor [Halioglobus sp.]|nr:TonB-dependent receptor [Halioglobus sp.]MDG2327254.1 TonB-dependent receptor [Halioglobus sp.]
MKHSIALTMPGLAIVLAQVGGVNAQESSLALEEVIVTATKREQNLQDVSVAVTALSEDVLREAQIVSSEDLTQLVPSLNLQKGSNVRQTSFNIRGIGTQSFSTAVEPSVSTMLDGVVMGRSGQAFMRLLDIERVEVLRGPQGTLFGKNSTGGVVHLITQDPTDEFSGEVMGSVLSGDEYRAGATISGPLTDTLGFRLTASGSDVDGYTKNYYDGDYYNGSKDWSVRGKLRWDATDNLSLKWASDYYDAKCDCSVSPMRSIEPYGGNESDVQQVLDRIAPIVPSDENDEVNINSIPATENSQWGHSLEINWDIGEYSLTSITAARGFEIDGKSDGDVDGQPITLLGFAQVGQSEQNQFTQELRLASPANASFNYVVGLFYFDQTVERQFTRSFEIVPGLPGEGIATFEADTSNWAAFGEATWQFSDSWRFIFGARYTEDELDFEFERVREGFPVGVPEPVPLSGQDTDEDDLSGKLALQWDYSDNGMTYLSYTEGYKGPAFDLTFGTDPIDLERIEPETSESWELGLKTRLWDGRLQLNLALFDAVYKDFQSQAYFDPDGIPDCPDDNPGCDPDDDPGGFLLINAGKVSTQGLELDLLAQLSENLRISGGLAIIDAKIDDYPAGVCSDGQKFRGECPDGLQDLGGGDLPFSPDLKLNLAASYTWQRDDFFNVIFNGSVRYQDEVQFGLHQDENTLGDAYTLLDAGVSLQSHSDSWEAAFFVKNLTDEFYPSFIFGMNAAFVPNGYFHRYSKLAERTYGMELRYRW